MIRICPGIGAVLLTNLLLTGTPAAQERQLGSDGDVTLSLPAQYRCDTTAPVTVTAPDPSLFTEDLVRLQRLLGLARAALGFECPALSSIEMTGVVAGQRVFSGVAREADGWRLVSGPAGAPTMASPSDSLIAPAPAGAVPVTGVTDQAYATQEMAVEAPASAATVAAQQAGVRVVRGRPLLVKGGWSGTIEREGIANAEEIATLGRFLDHIRIGLNPGIARASDSTGPSGSYSADARALCVANRLLSGAARNEILQPETTKKLRDWKGTGANEFELLRAKQHFNELLTELVTAAPRLPMKFIFVDRLMLRAFDPNQGGFPFLRPIELDLPQSDCFRIGNDYLPVAADLPSLWPMDPLAAEELIQRIPVDPAFPQGLGSLRKVFVAVELTLSGALESPIHGKLEDEPLVPIKIDVESVALYEDPDLERHLHTFAVDAPAPSVLLAGLPERIPMPEAMMLTEEAITMLLLKSEGDVLSDKAWHVLARQQSYNDVSYYQKERRHWIDHALRVARLDGYDPDYVPFFPHGKTLSNQERLDEQQLQAFREWSLARARVLGQRFEITGRLGRERDKSGFTGNLQLQVGDSPSQFRHVIERLESSGYAPGRVIRPSLRGTTGSHLDADFLASPQGARTTYFVMAHPLERLVPAVSQAQLASHTSGSGSWPVVLQVVVTDVELVATAPDAHTSGNSAGEVFLVYLQPHSVEVLSFDRSETLFEQAYDLAAIEADAAAKAKAAVGAEAKLEAKLAGADIVGLTLSMPFSQAEAAVRKRLQVARVREAVSSDFTNPFFRNLRQYENQDGSERILLFRATPQSGRLVGIGRILKLPEGTKWDDVKGRLTAKYGEPAGGNGAGEALWHALKDTASCHVSIGLVDPYGSIIEGKDFEHYERYTSILISESTIASGTSLNDRLKGFKEHCSPQIYARFWNSQLIVVVFDLSAYASENVTDEQEGAEKLDFDM